MLLAKAEGRNRWIGVFPASAADLVGTEQRFDEIARELADAEARGLVTLHRSATDQAYGTAREIRSEN